MNSVIMEMKKFYFNINSKGMIMNLIGVILLVIILLALLPTWPYSSGWGYYPSGGIGLVLLILIIVLLTRGV